MITLPLKTFFRKTIVTCTFLVMLWTNLGISGNLGDFSKETAEDSSMYYSYPTYFTPAPYTFIIWGAIYLGALVYVIIQFFSKHVNDVHMNTIGILISLAYLVNAITPFTPIGYSNIAVLFLFLFLLISYLQAIRLPKISKHDILVKLHIVIFLAWSIVALVLNTFQWLSSIHFTLGTITDQIIVFLLISLLSLIYSTFFHPKRNYAFMGVIVWAFIGILIQNPTTIIALAVLLNMAYLAWVIFSFKSIKN